METAAILIALAFEGLVIGAFARLALPGRDPLSLLQTMAVGLAGSLIAGIVVYALTDGKELASFLSSLAFATLIVYLIRRHRGGGLVEPAATSD